jgi:hypothetical protein
MLAKEKLSSLIKSDSCFSTTTYLFTPSFISKSSEDSPIFKIAFGDS